MLGTLFTSISLSSPLVYLCAFVSSPLSFLTTSLRGKGRGEEWRDGKRSWREGEGQGDTNERIQRRERVRERDRGKERKHQRKED